MQGYQVPVMSTLSVTIIQTRLFWEDKASNLQMLQEKIESVAAGEVVVLPEMFSTGFSMNPEPLAETMDGDTVAWMKDMAIKKRMIITGSLIITENGHYYNRLIWMLPNGAYGYYDKRHLFSYAGEDKHYLPGNKRLIASVKGWKVNLQVCYDLRFPVWARQTTQDIPEYDVLIYVANWPQRRNQAWKTLLQARAIENQSYVVGVNRVGNDGNNIYHSGDSMIIDPLGSILYHKEDSEDISTHILDKKTLHETRERFPFWKDGDRFLLEG